MALEPLAHFDTGGDFPAIVERITARIIASGMARPVVVGHSAGALHATACAAPQARIESWSDYGHMAHLAEPDRFASLVARFVTPEDEGVPTTEEARHARQ